METLHNSHSLLFRIAMWWRIAYGFMRLALGFILINLVGTPISDIFYRVMSHEISQDPSDILIKILTPLLQHFPITISYFIAIYFMFWGVIDIVLSIQLLKYKLWAFPLTIVLISTFIIYELYRFFHTQSFILLSIIFIDVIVVFLIYREYKSRTATKNFPSSF